MGVELDPQLVQNLKQKQRRRFDTAKHGCDQDQVDAFLVAIASSIEALEARLQEAQVAPPAPAGGVDARSRHVVRVGDMVERELDEMLAEARAEAAAIRSEAETEANGIVGDARDEVRRAVEEVQAFLDQVDEDTRRIPAQAEERRRQMVEETRTMQERLLRVAGALDNVLDTNP